MEVCKFSVMAQKGRWARRALQVAPRYSVSSSQDDVARRKKQIVENVLKWGNVHLQMVPSFPTRPPCNLECYIDVENPIFRPMLDICTKGKGGMAVTQREREMSRNILGRLYNRFSDWPRCLIVLLRVHASGWIHLVHEPNPQSA